MADNLLASKEARLQHLDLYKGICILFIIITHYEWTDNERLIMGFPFWIEMAVPIFMVITGYVTAASFHKRETTLRSAFHLRELCRKWLRFVLPFIPVYLLQLFIILVIRKGSLSILGVVKAFVTGGFGPGSYFIPVMLQAVLIAPIIWAVIKKYDLKGLIALFIINFVYEIMKTLMDMSPSIYRLCVLRYLFILSYGFFLYNRRDRATNNIEKLIYLLAGFLGVLYLVIFKYTTAEPIITNQWITTSLFAVLYIVPVMKVAVGLHHVRIRSIFGKLLLVIGRASYDVFLAQMVWYWEIARIVYRTVPQVGLRLLINIAVCCLLGLAYYKFENPINTKMIKKIGVL